MTDKKVTIEITKEACDLLRSFLMNDREEGTGEGYSDFILKAINIRRMLADLEADYTAQIAALTAERDALAQRLKIAEEVEIYLGDKLQEEKQLGANRREVNAHLARDCKKAEAERDALREALKPFADNAEVWEENESHFTVVYCRRGVKDKPDLKITVGDLLAARRVLGEESPLKSNSISTTAGEQGR